MRTAGDAAPAVGPSLDAGADERRLSLVPEPGDGAEDVEYVTRHLHVAADYLDLRSMRKVAKLRGMSTRTVLKWLNELGVVRYSSGQRPKCCELDVETRRDIVVALHERREPDQEIADALEVAKGTVENDLKARGVGPRKVGRKPMYPPPEPRKCGFDGYEKEGLEACRVIFTPPKPSGWEQRFHSRRCWGLYRIWIAKEYPDYFAPLIAACTSSESSKKHNGRRKLGQVADTGRHAKGREAALDVGRAAIALVQKCPEASRRELIETLMECFEGETSIRLPDGQPRSRRTDADYRRARARVMRRLVRAAQEMGQPHELTRLLRTDVASPAH